MVEEQRYTLFIPHAGYPVSLWSTYRGILGLTRPIGHPGPAIARKNIKGCHKTGFIQLKSDFGRTSPSCQRAELRVPRLGTIPEFLVSHKEEECHDLFIYSCSHGKKQS